MVVGLGADPSRCANPALSPAYKAEPHADAADIKTGSESETRTLGFLFVEEALWPLS